MNGVKTIVQAVPTFLPKLVPVGLLLLGLILGFLWAYVISPNVYTSAEPVHLGESWKQEYVKQVAWQLAASGDSNNAQRQLSFLGNAPKIVEDTIKANTKDANLAPKLEALRPLAADNPSEVAKITPSLLNSNLTPFLCVLGLAIIVGGGVILNSLVPISMLLQRRSTGPSTVVQGLDKERRDAIKAAQSQKTDFAKTAPDRGAPVAQFMSTYLLNDDVYDDSFAIETPSNEFLGETGAGISKTIGVGDPKKVTAIEAWVFDKNDIRTVTKVLMSEYCYNDEGLRAELAPKGEAVLAKPGGITMLETQTLTVQVRIVDLSYGTGNTPPNSFFDRLTLEIAAWPKKGPAVGASAASDPYTGDTSKFPAK